MQSTDLVRDEQRCKKEKQGHRCLAIKVNIKMTDVLETSVPEIKARPSDLKLHKKVFSKFVFHERRWREKATKCSTLEKLTSVM